MARSIGPGQSALGLGQATCTIDVHRSGAGRVGRSRSHYQAGGQSMRATSCIDRSRRRCCACCRLGERDDAWTTSRPRASSSAASTPACSASARPTTRATGRASTSTIAGPSPPPSSAIRKAVKFTPLTAKERFTALQSGEIDMLARNTTWTMSRDTSLGLDLRRRQLLRRPGLHGEEVAGRHLGAGARRRLGLRADRHHDRAQPRRLLQAQQHAVQPGRLREARRSRRGL